MEGSLAVRRSVYLSGGSRAALSSVMVNVTSAGNNVSLVSTSSPDVITAPGCLPGPFNDRHNNVQYIIH